MTDKTPYKDPKATGAKARANESEDNSHVSNDVFTNPSVAALSQTPTVEDPNGFERIVGPTVNDGWQPAPTDPDPEAVKRGKALEKTLEDAKKDRLDMLAGKAPKATNNPGDGGSQAGTA